MVDRLKFSSCKWCQQTAETRQKLGLLKLGSQTEVLTLDVQQVSLTA